MRKIVAGLFVSLDGVVGAPDQWHFPYFNDEMGEVVGSGMAAADTMLLGRVTYQEFAGPRPHVPADRRMKHHDRPSPSPMTTIHGQAQAVPAGPVGVSYSW